MQAWLRQLLLVVFIVPISAASLAAQDEIEFLSGAKLTGTVTSIDKDAKKVTFESKIGAITRERVYPYSRIHAVTYKGKRYVLTPKTASKKDPSPNDSGKSAKGDKRTRKEVIALIQSVGSTPPDWLDATRLNYPRTMDLSWPDAASSKWNTQKNIGQFIWSVINENPGRWREGVKFLLHVLSVNDKNSTAQQKAMIALGDKYHNLFQDYPRAAYWYGRAGIGKNPPRNNPAAPVHLAECYWRMGSKQMAAEVLGGISFRFEAIKLWADMGDIKKALKLTDAAVKSNNVYTVGHACIYAGDACRTVGQFPTAIKYYQRALNLNAGNDQRLAKRIQRIQNRARASVTAIQLFEQSDVSRVADGTYRSNSLGYEDQIHVEVAVKDHRIESVKVTKHREKQFYSALTDTPNKIIAKQGVKGVDTTSSATITSEAIINATAKALAQGSSQ
jgi:uncharacterized protein with FMN-binding domain